MMGAFLLIATCGTAALGFALIAFSQRQHWVLLRAPRRSTPPAWLRPAGWTILGLAVVPALVRDGPAFGLLLWTVMLTVSALLVIVLMARLHKHADSPD